MRPSTRLISLAAACAAAFFLAAPAAASAATRLGTAPALPFGARVVSAVPSTTPIHVTVTLQPRDPLALQAFADEVSTPGSPLFRDYITPAEFAQRFGATPAEVQAVEASLRAHGLTPGAPSANDLSIPVTATAGAVSRAFSVSLAHVALANGAGAIVNQQAPALDAGVAPDVQSILGLDTLSQAKPLLVRAHAAGTARPHVVTGGPQPCPAASTAAQQQNGLTADQIASTYGFSGLYQAGDQGAGQTVAVLELESYDPNDIAAYQACYGTAAAVSNVAVDGGGGGGSGSGEAALDIENVVGLAPKANVVVYEGPNSGAGPYDTFSAIISQHAAQVVTASWGQCEFQNGSSAGAAENTLFQQAAAEGMSIFSASGDTGAEDCFPSPPTAQVDDPASQPYVTGVGGTRIDSLGPRPSESVWNDGYPTGASGGGVSMFWTMPFYQAQAPGFLHVINAGSSGSTCGASSGYCREVPDVSADADPATGYLIYFNGSGAANPPQQMGWQVVGGTSGAAPLWAALVALANASAACNSVPIGFANPALYNAAATNYGGNFNDVTTGTNDMTGGNGQQFAAGPGYDMATGLGSPNGTSLAATLCADMISLTNPGAQRSIVHTSTSLQIKAYDSRNAPVTYQATGLPAGLSINGSTGKITGQPTRVGSSTVTLTVSDRAGTLAETTFTWAVQGNPALSHVTISSVGASRPTLSFTLRAGRGAPQLKTLTVTLPRGLKFTSSRASLSVTGVGRHRLRYTVALRRGALVIKLRHTSPQVNVTVSYPRFQATGSLVAHHAARITLTVRATDALTRTTKLSAGVKPRS